MYRCAVLRAADAAPAARWIELTVHSLAKVGRGALGGVRTHAMPETGGGRILVKPSLRVPTASREP